MRTHLLQHNKTKLISKTDSLRSAQQHSTRQVQTSERIYWYTGNMLGYCKLIICFPSSSGSSRGHVHSTSLLVADSSFSLSLSRACAQIMTLSGVTKSFAGLLASRFFIGVFGKWYLYMYMTFGTSH